MFVGFGPSASKPGKVDNMTTWILTSFHQTKRTLIDGWEHDVCASCVVPKFSYEWGVTV